MSRVSRDRCARGDASHTPTWRFWVFNLIVAAHVLFYVSFLETILVVAGGRKVYLIDVVFAFLGLCVLVALWPRKTRPAWRSQHSTTVLGMLMGWGLIGLARGIPRFGLSAFGEARLFVIPMLFYFFVATTYSNRTALKKLVTLSIALVCAMPVVRAIHFYFGGGRESFVDQFAGSDVLSTQAGFRFIQSGEAVLAACVAVGLFMFVAGGGTKKHRYGLLALAISLFIVVVYVQVRSSWATCVVGLVVGALLVRRMRMYLALGIVVGIVALAVGTMAPSVLQMDPAGQTSRFVASMEYSATFLLDPTADETTIWRLGIWQQALDTIVEHPLVGGGLGGYFENVDLNGIFVDKPFHNGYLVLLAKLGALGLALLLIALCLWFLEIARFVRREQDRYLRLLAKVFAVVLTMLATFAFFYDFTISFWIVLGAGTALVRLPRTAPLHTGKVMAGIAV